MAAAVGQDSVLAGSKKQKERRKRPCYELSPRKGVSAPLGTFSLLLHFRTGAAADSPRVRCRQAERRGDPSAREPCVAGYAQQQKHPAGPVVKRLIVC